MAKHRPRFPAAPITKIQRPVRHGTNTTERHCAELEPHRSLSSAHFLIIPDVTSASVHSKNKLRQDNHDHIFAANTAYANSIINTLTYFQRT